MCCDCIRQYSSVKCRAAAAAAAVHGGPSSAMAADDDELDEHDCGYQMGHWFATVPRGRWAAGRTAVGLPGGRWAGGGWAGGRTVVGLVGIVAAWWQAFVHPKPICISLQRDSLCMTSTC